MRILIHACSFWPRLGGIETSTEALARGFAALGHEVRVATLTPNPAADDFPFAVLRRPGALSLLGLVRWAEVVLHDNISLRAAWPLLFCPRRWMVAHQTGLRRPDGSFSLADRLKRLALRFATSIAISDAVAADLPDVAAVVHDPYRDHVFRNLDLPARPYDLAFLGRLVPDKGADLLFDALARLAGDGLTPRLLVIGDGPEAPALRRQAVALGLGSHVEFAGPLAGGALVHRLNEARILVVPSRWAEPFGIVALEAIACGLAVIGSAGGGLPEAIGPCGLTFPNGDAAALAARIAELLRRPEKIPALLRQAPAHLARHRPQAVARAYLAALGAR
jgi:glycogen(starch) synthase